MPICGAVIVHCFTYWPRAVVNETDIAIRFGNGSHRTNDIRWLLADNIMTILYFTKHLSCSLIIQGAVWFCRRVVLTDDRGDICIHINDIETIFYTIKYELSIKIITQFFFPSWKPQSGQGVDLITYFFSREWEMAEWLWPHPGTMHLCLNLHWS